MPILSADVAREGCPWGGCWGRHGWELKRDLWEQNRVGCSGGGLACKQVSHLLATCWGLH